MSKVSKVIGYWDEKDTDNAGWYVQVIDSAGSLIDDSAKFWFPVEVDRYGRDERAELIAVLALEYDGAEIEVGE